jgi:hypothetical protein
MFCKPFWRQLFPRKQKNNRFINMLNFSGFFDDSHVDVTPSKQPRSDMLFDSFETQPINKTLFDVKPLLCANDVPDDVQREITRRVREELWAIVQQEIEKIRHETAEQIEKIRKEMLSQNNLDIERRVTEQVEEILARERQKMEAEYGYLIILTSLKMNNLINLSS